VEFEWVVVRLAAPGIQTLIIYGADLQSAYERCVMKSFSYVFKQMESLRMHGLPASDMLNPCKEPKASSWLPKRANLSL